MPVHRVKQGASPADSLHDLLASLTDADIVSWSAAGDEWVVYTRPARPAPGKRETRG